MPFLDGFADDSYAEVVRFEYAPDAQGKWGPVLEKTEIRRFVVSSFWPHIGTYFHPCRGGGEFLRTGRIPRAFNKIHAFAQLLGKDSTREFFCTEQKWEKHLRPWVPAYERLPEIGSDLDLISKSTG